MQQISRGLASAAAIREIAPGMRLGLGSGRAVATVIAAIGQRIAAEGLSITAVAASRAAAAQARLAGIRLLPAAEIPDLDLGFDGADFLTEDLTLIKGGGGALVRERLVALRCRRYVIVAEATKLKRDLRGIPLPVAVLAFDHHGTARRLEAMGAEAVPRGTPRGSLARSDEGLILYDCRDRLDRPPSIFAQDIARLPGVVDTGLFAGLAQVAYLGSPAGVRHLGRHTAWRTREDRP